MHINAINFQIKKGKAHHTQNEITNCLDNGHMGNKSFASLDESREKSVGTFIVLADDDADDRDLFSEAVADCGFKVKVETASDGVELIHMLKNKNEMPELIFLDLNMPNKNGRDCLIEIRKSEELKHIPIVIYSTSSSRSDIDFTYENGANLFIRKPSSFRELVQIARKVLALDWKEFQPKSNKAHYVFSLKE
jgi:CheY-like chemotaxis protein